MLLNNQSIWEKLELAIKNDVTFLLFSFLFLKNIQTLLLTINIK